jgi:hypothetical protein
MKHYFKVLSLSLVLAACGGPQATDPTSPGGSPPPVTIPSAPPAPAATPTPAHLKAETYCVPKPPDIFGFKVKVHSDRGWKKILDAKPLVGPDAAYCASQNQGGTVCVVRREDDPMATTCSNLVTGKSDEGGYGPNWFYNDHTLCRPAGEGGNEPGCRLHEDNQFLVYTFGPGKYTACSADAMCTEIIIED